jgi:uncharacterized protein (TIGR00369 family)
VITERLDGSYKRLRQQSHPFCVVCGDANRNSLGMNFRSAGDGTIQATFACERAFEGYPNVLHGGVICALLDGAMTNCLFAHGCAGVTADLNVRFCHPVAANGCATIRAWVESSLQPLYKLAAELIQGEEVKATAKARFVERTTAAQIAQRSI